MADPDSDIDTIVIDDNVDPITALARLRNAQRMRAEQLDALEKHTLAELGKLDKKIDEALAHFVATRDELVAEFSRAMHTLQDDLRSIDARDMRHEFTELALGVLWLLHKSGQSEAEMREGVAALRAQAAAQAAQTVGHVQEAVNG